jgi:hypothetical protein
MKPSPLSTTSSKMVAAYGYDYRTEAEANVASARLTMIIATALGLAGRDDTCVRFCVFYQQADQHAGEIDAGTRGRRFRHRAARLDRKDEVGLVTRAVEKFNVVAKQRAREEAEAKINRDQVPAEQRRVEMNRIADGFESVV